MKKSLEFMKIEPIDREPWVKLADGNELAQWDRQKEVIYNQANRQTQKYRFFVEAFDFLTENRIGGDYHEYGCHRGRTFRMALTEARRHNLDSMKFFGFDSFKGLPKPKSQPSVAAWEKGALFTSEEEFARLIKDHGIYVENVRLTKGFYQETLTKELQDQFLSKESQIALACIDCDLYESAVPVFKFIEPLLQEGSLLYIDDFFSGYKGSPVRGVARAFAEFQSKSRYKFVFFMQVGWWGRSFVSYLEDERQAPGSK